MPRPGPPMPYLPVKLPADLLEWIDEAAAARRVTRSEMVRQLLRVAQAECAQALVDGTFPKRVDALTGAHA